MNEGIGQAQDKKKKRRVARRSVVAFAKNPALRVRLKAENASSFLTCAAGLIFSVMRAFLDLVCYTAVFRVVTQRSSPRSVA